MAADKISLSLTADTSELKDGASEAKSLIAGLSAPLSDVSETATAMSAAVKTAFDRIAAAAPNGALNGLGRLFGETGGAAQDAAGGIEGAGAAMAETARAGGGVGAALLAVQQAVSVAKTVFDAFKSVLHQTAAALNWAGEISDTATQLGISVEALQEYKSAAQSAGVNASEFAASMTSLRTTLDDVRSGLGDTQPQMEAFTRLGFSKEQLAGFTSVDQVLPEIADRLKGVGSEAERAAIADRLGIRPLLPLLEKGSADLADLRQKAADAGGEIDGKTAAAMRQLKSDTDRASDGVNGNLKIAFLGLAPILNQTLGLLNQLSRALADFMQGFVRVDQRVTQSLKDEAAELEARIKPMEERPTSRNDALLAQLKAKLAEIDRELASRAPPAALPAHFPRVPPPPAKSLTGETGGDGHGASGCDPTAAQACEIQSQAVRTDAAAAGASARVSANAQADAQIASDHRVSTKAYVAGQDYEVSSSRSAADSKVQISHAATNRIINDNDRALRGFKSTLDGLVSSLSKGLLRMAEGTQSFAQTMRSVGQQILNDFISKVIDPMIEKWLWKEAKELAATILGNAQKAAATTAGDAAGLAAGEAFAQTQKITNAQVAFSGAIAAISPIPFIGPEIAPGIAASMAALATAAGGYDIPMGVNPLTQLHAQEMVLPARLANPMRALMDDYAAGSSGPWSGPAQGGGDTHVHNYNISAMDTSSFKTFLRGNKNPLSTVLQEMARAGMKTA